MTTILANNYRRFWTLFIDKVGNETPFVTYYSKDAAIAQAQRLASETPDNPVYIMEATQGYVVPPRTPVLFVPSDE